MSFTFVENYRSKTLPGPEKIGFVIKCFRKHETVKKIHNITLPLYTVFNLSEI